ncbi:MAG: ATP-binding protein [Rhodospirillaceae bacterium]|nr:ATP-binding protein [Rhodospirillaceae bacterium]
MAQKTPPKRPAKAARKPAQRPAVKLGLGAAPRHPLAPLLARIAGALERQAPAVPDTADMAAADAFVWHAESGALSPVKAVSRVPLRLLKGIDRQAELLLANTTQHADGYPANNALLWGARGAGKSSLVKAVQAEVNAKRQSAKRLALVEIHREDIQSLPRLLSRLRETRRQCVLFCDDLSFEGEDRSYKALKAVLEGGLEGRPANVVFYATSNRRHMLARNMIENERATAIHDSEAVEEKVSLSDRFGLWLGFHNLDQDTFLDIVAGYAAALKLPLAKDELRARAIEWSVTRGARSGRVAWQLIQAIAGELKIKVDPARM